MRVRSPRGTLSWEALVDDRALIWFPGVGWDETKGTDRRIVEEIASRRSVIWIDPPSRHAWRGWRHALRPGLERTDGVLRIRVPATVGVSRWPFRILSDFFRWRALRSAVDHADDAVIVVANPLARLPRSSRYARVLYLTDDWIDGASLMGLSQTHVRAVVARNTARADAVIAVSPPLIETTSVGAHAATAVIPNGAPQPRRGGERRKPIAGLVGQLNERLDVDTLMAVVQSGVPLRIVGPLVVRDNAVRARFEELFSHPMTDWRGPVPASEVGGHLDEIAVGLTPYLPTPFNRASSPLKTLEYLSAGVPVVSSDLPASAWLDSEFVRVAKGRESFVGAVREMLDERDDPHRARRCSEFAAAHSWFHRADDLLDVVAELESREHAR